MKNITVSNVGQDPISIIEKIVAKLYLKFIKIKYRHTHYFYAGDLHVAKQKRVVLFLDYPKAIHFGDTLWFEPIARMLKQELNLVICANKMMHFYFAKLGYTLITKDEISCTDFIVTRRELSYYLRGMDVFYINFIYDGLTKPLIQHIMEQVALKMNINYMQVASKPAVIYYTVEEQELLRQKFQLSANDKYIIYNDYIDSFKPRTPHSAFINANKELSLYMMDYAIAHGYKVIYTGSKHDLAKRSESHGFINIDLRGRTSIEEAFILASLPNVYEYIGYDTFWMHLFNLYDKYSHIMLKPGFSSAYYKQVQRYVAVPYAHSSNNMIFING